MSRDLDIWAVMSDLGTRKFLPKTSADVQVRGRPRITYTVLRPKVTAEAPIVAAHLRRHAVTTNTSDDSTRCSNNFPELLRFQIRLRYATLWSFGIHASGSRSRGARRLVHHGRARGCTPVMIIATIDVMIRSVAQLSGCCNVMLRRSDTPEKALNEVHVMA